MKRLVILDNEAVQALQDPAHPKHRQVVGHAQVVASRKRRAIAIQMVVPTTVRVEAAWDRTSAAWAFRTACGLLTFHWIRPVPASRRQFAAGPAFP